MCRLRSEGLSKALPHTSQGSMVLSRGFLGTAWVIPPGETDAAAAAARAAAAAVARKWSIDEFPAAAKSRKSSGLGNDGGVGLPRSPWSPTVLDDEEDDSGPPGLTPLLLPHSDDTDFLSSSASLTVPADRVLGTSSKEFASDSTFVMESSVPPLFDEIKPVDRSSGLSARDRRHRNQSLLI
jgi:hypothetical protein